MRPAALLPLLVTVLTLATACDKGGEGGVAIGTETPAATTEAGVTGTPAQAETVEVSLEGGITDPGGDLVDVLALSPVDDVPEDVAPTIDIVAARVTVEGEELVLIMQLAGDVGEAPEDIIRGYDFVLAVEGLNLAGRGAYTDAGVILGAEPEAGRWVLFGDTGIGTTRVDGNLTVEGNTVTLRIPLSALPELGDPIRWRAVAWHQLSEESTPADMAPDGTEFATTAR